MLEEKGAQPTSIKMSLWSKTPLRMLANVMHDIMMRAPTKKPPLHASKMSAFGSAGLATTFLFVRKTRVLTRG